MSDQEVDAAEHLQQEAEPGDLIRVAVLCGSDDERSIIWSRGVDVGSKGNNDSWRLIKAQDEREFAWRRTHVTPGYFRQPRRWTFDKFDLVWNMITDPDQNPATLEVATRVLSEARLPIVNRPSQMAQTRRDRMSERLQGVADAVVPKVLLIRNPNEARIRKAADAAGFRFPAIVRRTGTQNGTVLGVFERPEDLRAIFGDRRNEYFMIEFHDLRFSDGFFRKTRYIFIGDAIVPRQHIISDGWNIHGADARRVTAVHEHFQRESDEVVIGGSDGVQPAVLTQLRAIKARLPIEYCGIDCCVTEEGRVVVFEVNATMNVWPREGRIKDENRRVPAEAAIAAVRRLILSKIGKDEQAAAAVVPIATLA